MIIETATIIQALGGVGGLGLVVKYLDNRAKQRHEREEADKAEFKALWREAHADLDNLRNQLVEVRIEQGQARSEVASLRSEVESLTRRLGQSSAANAALHAKIEELENYISELRRERDDALEASLSCQRDLAMAEIKILELKEQESAMD